jgi:hypothetical protein
VNPQQLEIARVLSQSLVPLYPSDVVAKAHGRVGFLTSSHMIGMLEAGIVEKVRTGDPHRSRFRLTPAGQAAFLEATATTKKD